MPSVWLRRVGPAALGLLGAGAAAYVLVGVLHAGRTASSASLADSPLNLAAMLGVVAVGYLAQTASLQLILRSRLGLRSAALLPWACSAVNRVVPVSLGGVVLLTRAMRRRDLSYPAAGAAVAALGAAHTAAGLLLAVMAFSALSASGGASAVLPSTAVLLGGTGVSLVIAVLVVARRRWRRRLRDAARDALLQVDLRQWPVVVCCQLGSRLAPAVVLWLVLGDLNSSLSFSTVIWVVVLAGAAGSVIPLPGGGGGVEVALAALLVHDHVAGSTAAAAVLLARFVDYWLPAALGVVAFLALRRDLAVPQIRRRLGVSPVPAP